MKKNIGTKDRIFRLILGILCFVGIYFASNDIFKGALFIFGLFCFFQATFSWCAFYALIGKNTCPIEKQ
uniref:DUF2892 domain-containing protein n=1 Tax=candidate division WWE3 bacterium TaxID=2053526 RepID=A0A7C4TJD9_UNCKA